MLGMVRSIPHEFPRIISDVESHSNGMLISIDLMQPANVLEVSLARPGSTT